MLVSSDRAIRAPLAQAIWQYDDMQDSALSKGVDMPGSPITTVSRDGCPQTRRMLQGAIIAFFTSVVAVLVILYLVAPSIYLEILQQTEQPTDTHPLAVNLFIGAILIFVAAVGYGVIRGWRWIFWPMLLVFLASVLELPAGILQLVGVIPIQQPTWYILLRMAIGVVELALGLWMLRVWRACGVWALGRAG